MIIEFFGISGVGKSTLCKGMYKKGNFKWPRYRLYEKNNWLFRNIKKLLSNIIFLILNIKWFFTLNKCLKKMDIKSTKDKCVILFNGCSLKDLQNKCKKKEKYLFDEGIFQYIWSIYLRTDKDVEKDDVLNLIRMFQMPDTLYVVNANIEVIYNRLISRGRTVKILESDNLTDNIKKMKYNQNRIIKICEGAINNIVFIDNN